MNGKTCIVIGGGYAGIHAVKAILKVWKAGGDQGPLRLVLIDKQSEHIRKVLLFKPAATAESVIKVPFKELFPEGVKFVQGTVTGIDSQKREVWVQDLQGGIQSISYDMLVAALGSVVRQPASEQGGIALADLDSARRIRETWQHNLEKAARESDSQERQRLLTIAVAGAGISGMETAAELAHYARAEARNRGLLEDDVRIHLYNAIDRLFPEGPKKVGQKLERHLSASGVSAVHGCKVLQEKEGVLTLSTGDTARAGLCIWTLGLLPNPALQAMGLPVNEEGYVMVDRSYRVNGAPGVYSIGDCAHITDAASGRADGKTCKEAIAQAVRLGRIIVADLEGRRAPEHESYMDSFCFGLGPEQGMAWTRKWGIDFVITGKLGWALRKFTWDSASFQ
ncbi:pyridine nucleotide-disulfide oxidoreductase [Paenibacillus sp. 1011MAR3C5]|uniref:NAD(P)/FAD-dependent oxidoreductase n=1 Tax=Paenibacillus sp. 1011MAR3C5 TaxID=1675787 RepID=UPI000E6D20BF|nr:FAD-dependent oxidoreductase [Paenibacillus sp. 1011MAR3C5]RJE87467.1 pyridine nucleotide-disulfide oxidoreductase [Paenibacillus sp. 1011MAR3C5]